MLCVYMTLSTVMLKLAEELHNCVLTYL